MVHAFIVVLPEQVLLIQKPTGRTFDFLTLGG